MKKILFDIKKIADAKSYMPIVNSNSENDSKKLDGNTEQKSH
jgi:hypothetical protein